MTHLRFEVVLSRYGICVGDRMLFRVSEWIRDITRRSGMVRKIRFIYWGSFSKLEMFRSVCMEILEGFGMFWKVLEDFLEFA